MRAGICRATIFSKSVMRGVCAERAKVQRRRCNGSESAAVLHHGQPAGLRGIFAGDATAQKLHDLIAQLFAARAPATGSGQLFYAGAQTREADHLWSVGEFFPHFGTEPVE